MTYMCGMALPLLTMPMLRLLRLLCRAAWTTCATSPAAPSPASTRMNSSTRARCATVRFAYLQFLEDALRAGVACIGWCLLGSCASCMHAWLHFLQTLVYAARLHRIYSQSLSSLASAVLPTCLQP